MFYVVTKADWLEMIKYASTDVVCRLADIPKGKHRVLFLERPLFFNKRALNNCYKIALNSWRNFLTNKQIGDDIDLYENVQVDDVKNVYAELLLYCHI